jgi:putative transposase
MTRKKKALDTIWEVSDELWAIIEPILCEDCPPPKNPGRPRTDWRRCLNGIIFRMRTGCQWNRLPKVFGDDSTVHRWFQRWNRNGVMKRIWAELVSQCDELEGVDWEWQSADGSMGKARFGGMQSGPTRRTVGKTARNAA